MSVAHETPKPQPHAPTPRPRATRGRLAGGVRAAIGVAAIAIATVALWMAFSDSGERTSRFGRVLPASEFEAETGIRILRVGLSGASGILDVRYLVLDPDKALIVHDEENAPAVIDESTGAVFGRSSHDHTSVRSLRTGGTYFFLLLNEHYGLDHGDTVSIKVGDALLADVKVQ